MYFWNTQALATELKEGSLEQGEKVKYFIIFVIVEFLGFDLIIYLNDPFTDREFIESSFTTIFVGVAIYLCYRINRDGDDSEFIDRYICISFPISIKVIFLIFGIFLALLTVSIILGDEFSPWVDEDSLILSGSGVVIALLYYWRIWVAIKWISHPQDGGR